MQHIIKTFFVLIFLLLSFSNLIFSQQSFQTKIQQVAYATNTIINKEVKKIGISNALRLEVHKAINPKTYDTAIGFRIFIMTLGGELKSENYLDLDEIDNFILFLENSIKIMNSSQSNSNHQLNFTSKSGLTANTLKKSGWRITFEVNPFDSYGTTSINEIQTEKLIELIKNGLDYIVEKK